MEMEAIKCCLTKKLANLLDESFKLAELGGKSNFERAIALAKEASEMDVPYEYRSKATQIMIHLGSIYSVGVYRLPQ